LLILFGEADDWANVKACPRMVERQDRATKDRLTVVLYPGAYHDFDVGPRPPREYLGHHIEYNEAAATESFKRTKAFFDERLKND
jgi:dienelactone hydrolase